VSETSISESWILDSNSESATKTEDPALDGNKSATKTEDPAVEIAESVNRVTLVVFGFQNSTRLIIGVGFVLDPIV
jgi:hypothetical protein